MINYNIIRGLNAISSIMKENRDYLIQLDQRNGDGDLGISMSEGFQAVSVFAAKEAELPTAKLLHKCGAVFNEAAPSSLGTIMSFGFLGMAKYLKSQNQPDLKTLASAMQAGLDMIMEKAGSKPGEKTILDSLCPGVAELIRHVDDGVSVAFSKAVEAAEKGMEATKEMKSVHGRAAYYGEKSIGLIDGGAVVGKLLFEALFHEFVK